MGKSDEALQGWFKSELQYDYRTFLDPKNLDQIREDIIGHPVRVVYEHGYMNEWAVASRCNLFEDGETFVIEFDDEDLAVAAREGCTIKVRIR